jgi:uncharacterized protein YdhG (YjbR/CyaY superfamily)
MKAPRTIPNSVDDYIAGFPPDVQRKLKQVRSAIRKAAPNAEEVISYRMPAFRLEGQLVFFAGFPGHIGIYPKTEGMAKLEKQLAPYRGAKKSIRLPLEKPVPVDLIGEVVKIRVKENLASAAVKKKARAAKVPSRVKKAAAKPLSTRRASRGRA